MKINGNEIRPGNVIEHKGTFRVAVTTRGGQREGPAYASRAQERVDGTKLNDASAPRDGRARRLEQKDYQFLFAEGDMLTFMDVNLTTRSRSQPTSSKNAPLPQDGMTVTVEHETADRHLPDQVTLEVVEADPVVKARPRRHPINRKLENGVRTWCHLSFRRASAWWSTPTAPYVRAE
jgi:elongation factor P